MRRSLLALFLATLVPLTLATPDAFAQGLNLYWNDCGNGGSAATSKTFACDTNVGTPLTMVVSAFPPVEMPQFVAVEGHVDVLVNSASLPAWWQTASGQCRAGAVSATCDVNSFGTLGCPDIWDGAPAVSVYDVISAHLYNAFRIRFAAALAAPSPITAEEVGQELVVGTVRITRARTVGADACAGCLVGACLMAIEIKLIQPGGVGDVLLSYPATNNWVQLNGGVGPNNCYVPAVNRTWGAIKALYR